MFERYVNSKLYSFFDKLYIIVLINLLWLFFSLIGLVVFAFMPATVAVYLIALNIRKDIEIKPFRTFINIFKKEYIKSQKVFLMVLILGVIVYTNTIFYVNNLEIWTGIHLVGLIVMGLIMIAYVSMLIHLIPVYIYFPELKPYQIIKNAFLLGFAYPLRTFLALVLMLIIVFITTVIQPLLPFFLIAVIALVSLRIVKDKYVMLRKDKPTLNIEDYIPDSL